MLRATSIGMLHRMFRLPILMVAFSLLVAGCPDDPVAYHPSGLIHFPVGIAADPNGDYLFVVNSNFDLAYEYGSILTIDLATHKVVKSASAQISSFGGKVGALSTDGRITRLFVPSRFDNTLTWLEVSRETEEPVLKCAGAPVDGRQVCAGKYVLGDADGEITPGSDPFGIVVQPAGADGQPGYVYASSFQGRMAVYRLDENNAPTDGKSVALIGGSYELALHPSSGAVYATTKRFNLISQARVVDATESEDTDAFDVKVDTPLVVTNATAGQDFGRGIAFNAAGTLAFVAYRTPASLVVLDTALTAEGVPNNRVLTMISLSAGPASVAIAQSGPNRREFVYVSIYGTNEVHVVDPAIMEVVAVIPTGDGPFDIAIVDTPDRFRAYVTLFEADRISVIELDRTSPYFHQEIAQIR